MRDFRDNGPDLFGELAQHPDVFPGDLDIDGRAGGRAALGFGHGDPGAGNILDPLANNLDIIHGRGFPVFEVDELNPQAVVGIFGKKGTARLFLGRGIDVFNIVDIRGALECTAASFFVYPGGIGPGVSFFKGGRRIICPRIGHRQFDFFNDPIHVFQVRAFRGIDIHIGAFRINAREKFHGFFQADDQLPDLDQRKEQQKRRGHHGEAVLERIFKHAPVGTQYNALDLNRFFTHGLDI